jgi:osmotically-inducible protein OsmY/sporulation protein YlmC with PRC-barrel domain
MAKFDFSIGSQVHCTDGECGRLLKVVVDPHTQRITDLVVERGFVLPVDRVLPAEVVERTRNGDVYLGITEDTLKSYPEYREVEFKEAASGVQAGHYDRGDVRCWASAYRLACTEPVIPLIKKRIHVGVDADLAVVERGTPVVNSQGTIGKVDHLLADAENGEITHLVVRKGLLMPYYPILPISAVRAVSDEAVSVDLTEEEIDDLVRYRERSPEDIQAELVDRMAKLGFDLNKIRVEVVGNVVQFTGWVPSIAAKRHAEAIARAVEGVIDVENMLDTDISILGAVIHALVTDPRTDVSAIEVTSEQGVVTLRGVVDNTQIRDAAAEIAVEQPGVLSVVNKLEIQADKYTAWLVVRSFAFERRL